MAPTRKTPRSEAQPSDSSSGSLFGGEGSPAKQKVPAATISNANGILAHVDGGARGNPGPAGYGVHIQNAAGVTIAELSEYLGHKTNNYAEYSGLLAALDYALQHKHGAVKVVSDSELLVKQMRGEYKVKSPDLRVLYDQARAKLRQLDSFEIGHVLRHKNRDADRLANAAMDRGMGRAVADVAHSPVTVRASSSEMDGIVRDGVVRLLDGELAEGTRVKVRQVKA